MFNVFRAWHFMERVAHRSICFKSGGGSSKIPETEAQRANSEVALNEFNDYMSKIRPFENKFIEDISADTTNREARVAGMTNADIAQKVGTQSINPNVGFDAGSVSDLATTASGAQIKANRAVKTQKAAGLQAVIDIGRGQANQAQLGLGKLASQSVTEASNAAFNNQAVDDAKMSAGASMLGMSAGLANNLYEDSKKKA